MLPMTSDQQFVAQVADREMESFHWETLEVPELQLDIWIRLFGGCHGAFVLFASGFWLAVDFNSTEKYWSILKFLISDYNFEKCLR